MHSSSSPCVPFQTQFLFQAPHTSSYFGLEHCKARYTQGLQSWHLVCHLLIIPATSLTQKQATVHSLPLLHSSTQQQYALYLHLPVAIKENRQSLLIIIRLSASHAFPPIKHQTTYIKYQMSRPSILHPYSILSFFNLLFLSSLKKQYLPYVFFSFIQTSSFYLLLSIQTACFS